MGGFMKLTTRLFAFGMLCLCLYFTALPVIAQVAASPSPSATPIVAPADGAELKEYIGFAKIVVELYKDGKILGAAAGLTLILVFLFRKFLMARLKLKPGVLPLVSLLLGALAGWASAVLAGATAGQAALALLAGPVASQAWDIIVKYFFPKPEVAKVG
jgi:hypothetical protein